MPEFEPTNSPTTAPTTASVTETFRPEKIAGSAWGRLTARNTCNRLPCIARARSTMSGSTDLKPCTAETTTGKKPSRNAEITLGTMPKPNQTTNSGAIAMYFAKQYPDEIKKVVTLDNLRVPFMTDGKFKILSFRSHDQHFKPDPGVVPDEEQCEKAGITVVNTD